MTFNLAGEVAWGTYIVTGTPTLFEAYAYKSKEMVITINFFNVKQAN